MRNLMAKLGVKLEDPADSAVPARVDEVVQTVLQIYDQCLLDRELSRAAYGCAIGGISMALNVNLRTAALLFEHAMAIRELNGASLRAAVKSLTPEQKAQIIGEPYNPSEKK